MSHRTLHVPDLEAANHDRPDIAPNQESKAIFDDSSVPLFTMYCKMTEEDNTKVEGWLKWVDKVVIFMGLFATVVAALLTMTVLDLKRDPQDTSAFYLGNMYELQVLGDSNVSRPFTPAQPPRFSTPGYAIWANALLFMSLCLNIFTAILALMIRESVPQYFLAAKSPKVSSLYRARMHEIVSNELYHSLAFWALRVMMHLSAWLFFVGISIYLFNINQAVFGPVFCCSCLCFIAYCIVGFWLGNVPDRSLSSGVIDDRVLKRLFGAVVEDSDLVQFLESIPGFCRSSVVRDPVGKVVNLGTEKLHMALRKTLEHTWSSPFLSNLEKMRRLVACVNVADAVRLPGTALSILEDIFSGDRNEVLESVEIGQSLRSPGNSTQQGISTGEEIGLCAQCIVAGIISNVQENNDRWIALSADQLGQPEDVIRGHLEHSNDNVLLANLTHITRQIIHSLQDNREMAVAASFILPSLSNNFDVRNTFPGLQQDFLALWNEIDREAPRNKVLMGIRDNLCNLHDNLTRGDPLPRDSMIQHDPPGHAFHVGHDTRNTILTLMSSNGNDVSLPLGSEVGLDSLVHASVDHNTRSTTLSRSSSSLSPSIPLHILFPSRLLSQQTPGHTIPELADELSTGSVRSS